MKIELKQSEVNGEQNHDNCEQVQVFVDGKYIDSFTINYDCPEDSTIGRLGVFDFISKVIKAINEDAEIIKSTNAEWRD
jgi:hypothetical protein